MSDSKNNQPKSITGLNDIDADEIIINGNPLDYIGLANSFPAYQPKKYLRCNSAGTAVELTAVVETDVDLTQQGGVIVFQQTAGTPPATSVYHGIKFDDTNAIGFPATTDSLVLSNLNPAGAGGGEYYLRVNWGTPLNGKILKCDTAQTPPFIWADESDPAVGQVNGVVVCDGGNNFDALTYGNGLTFTPYVVAPAQTPKLELKIDDNGGTHSLEVGANGLFVPVAGTPAQGQCISYVSTGVGTGEFAWIYVNKADNVNGIVSCDGAGTFGAVVLNSATYYVVLNSR